MAEPDLLVAPIYTAAEVARLINADTAAQSVNVSDARRARMSAPRVARWLRGYDYSYRGTKRSQAPVVRHATDSRFATFLDLMEIRIGAKFIAQGFSPQKVRSAFMEAARLVGEDRPFAKKVFYTLGRNIFLQIRDQNDPEVANLVQLFTGGQWTIGEYIVQDATRIDFDPQNQFARRWWPLGKDEPVVIDPAIGFGAATLVNRGLKTLNIYRTYLSEGQRTDAVARWLKIGQAEVLAAVRWEECRLLKAA